jgi:hypothetical protein
VLGIVALAATATQAQEVPPSSPTTTITALFDQLVLVLGEFVFLSLLYFLAVRTNPHLWWQGLTKDLVACSAVLTSAEVENLFCMRTTAPSHTVSTPTTGCPTVGTGSRTSLFLFLGRQ